MIPAEIIRGAAADLNAVGARWALVGGMAVTFRGAERFTKDLDFAVAVADDPDAHGIVFGLQGRGYFPGPQFNNDQNDRLSTVRLERMRGRTGVIVDLLFASSGIEPEIVAAAEVIEVLPRVRLPLATAGHLIAMKALAVRYQDIMDLEALIPAASPADLRQAREAAGLIAKRGFGRDVDVVANLEHYIREAGR